MLFRPDDKPGVIERPESMALFRPPSMDDHEVVAEAKSVIRSTKSLREAINTGNPVAVASAYLAAAEADPTLPIDLLLPILFTLKGEPYTLKDHFVFAPMFRLFCMPKITYWQIARQMGKTQNASTQDVLMAALIPYMSILNVTPLYEQARRWSSNYIKPLMDGCCIPGMVQSVGRSTSNSSVLQRAFPNGSHILFSFAFLDCERVRGVSASKMNIDEVQGMNPSFVPIIREVLSGSKLALERYTGTPKTTDNTAHYMWERSSQASWACTCEGCNKENIFSPELDLTKNIGKNGPICRFCGKLLNPRTGYYVHAFPDKRWRFSGYHVPQIVHPVHYEIPAKWQDLLDKMENMKENQFMNECLAISSDVGAKLVSQDTLRKCGVLPTRRLEWIRDHAGDYHIIVTATDWGGKGKKKNARATTDETELEYSSYTAFAVAGLSRKTNQVEILYVERMKYSADPSEEASRSLGIFFGSGSQLYAHDFTGAGNVRETMVLQQGFNRGLRPERLMPFTYTSTSPQKSIVSRDVPSSLRQGVRSSYSLDKARICFLVAFMLQKEQILLPDYNIKENKECLDDFLAWQEDTQETPRGNKVTRIMRDPNRPDDVAQACAMACAAIWHATQRWPEMSHYVNSYVSYSGDQLKEELGSGEQVDWDEQLS